MWWRRSWFSLKGKAGIPGQERSRPATSARPRAPPAGSVQQRAEALSLSAETVRRRIRWFNAEGLTALEDHHRTGRPATYSTDAVATVIATALTSPRRLDLPFAAWTLDRLAAYLLERKGI